MIVRIARINVQTEKINYEEITKDSEYFLFGARGLSSKIVHDEIDPMSDPLGEKNKLIIANGLLTGSPFPNSARTSVGGKSPLTGGVKEANVGGRPSLMLALHGYRALVLQGASDKLRLIIIEDGKIKLIPAKEYEKMGNYELHSQLKEKYGKNIGIYSIGPAGEHKMKNSTVCANDLEGYPSRHAARGGLGAVMGSKGIKAVVILPIKGSRVKIHDIKKFRSYSSPFAKELATTKEAFSIYGTAMGMNPMSEYGGLPTKNFRIGSFENIENISGEKLHEVITSRGGKKRLPCSPTCVIKCSNLYVDEKGNHVTSSLEYETMVLNGSNLMIDDLDILARIDHLCDDIGVDTIEFGGTVGVAMDEARVEWGDAERVFDILEEIRNNTEIGQLYGNGVRHIGKILNAKRIPEVKGQGISAYDPRVMKGMGVTFSTTPMGADHTAGAAIAGRVPRQGKDYGELTEDKGKLELSRELQIYTAVLDSMGCCYFIGPSYETMELVANALNAMYDLDLTREEVIAIGKKIIRYELEFNKKAGVSHEKTKIPKFFKEETVEPTGLKYTFSDEDIENFWKELL